MQTHGFLERNEYETSDNVVDGNVSKREDGGCKREGGMKA
jgi:hypothetical protein